MIMHNVLFATDFSAESNSIAQYAISLARDHGGRLYLIHVVEPPPPIGAAVPYGAALVDQNDILLTSMLEEFVEDAKVDHECHILVGDPASEIVRFARDNTIDVIVLGTHGRTGLTRLLMGSVAETVLRRAPCPVLSVKQTESVVAGEPA